MPGISSSRHWSLLLAAAAGGVVATGFVTAIGIGCAVGAALGIAIFLRLLRGHALGGRAARGLTFGLAWGLVTLSWVFRAAPYYLDSSPGSALGLTIVAAVVYVGLCPLIMAALVPWLPAPIWLSLPAAWVLIEQIGRVAGATPGALGYSLQSFLPAIQLAEVTGVSGLSFIVAMIGAALSAPPSERRWGLPVAGCTLLGLLLFGFLRLTAPLPREAHSMIVHAVGGAAPGERTPVRARQAKLRHYRQQMGTPRFVTLWPEAALPGYLQEDAAAQAAVRRIARHRGWLLVGSPRYAQRGSERRIFNSAILFSPRGEIRGIYDKRNLFPVGERAYAPGEQPMPLAPLRAGPLRLGVLICYDVFAPSLARQYARAGVDVLTLVSSDEGFGWGMWETLYAARVRAIETRRPVVRASRALPSYVIDPLGHILPHGSLAIPTAATGPTFYAQHGEWMLPGCLGLLGTLYMLQWRQTFVAHR